MENKGYIEVDGVLYFRLSCHDISAFYEGMPSRERLWKHKDCEGDVYVGENACLYCDKCGQISHLSNVTWHSPLTSISFDSFDYYVSFYNATPYHPYTRNDVGSVILQGAVREGRMSLAWVKEFLNNL